MDLIEVSKLVNRALSYKSDEAAACCGGSASLLGKSCFMFVPIHAHKLAILTYLAVFLEYIVTIAAIRSSGLHTFPSTFILPLSATNE